MTDRLYGGDTEHRLRQEIVLGVGGVRALQALGHDVQVFHTNEGHAGFLGLERMRQLVHEGLTFDEALEASRAGNIFTTHTPVPAGIDRFPRELMKRYFDGFADELGISFDDLMRIGHRDDEPDETRFNMAVMGLRLGARANGVAKLHGEVSRKMFAALWPDVPVDEVPITSITNGVHAPTWVAPEIDALLSRAVLPDWVDADDVDWARVADVRDDELWRAKEQGRERLVTFVRERQRASQAGPGCECERRRLVRHPARPGRAHRRLRPPVRHLQAGHAAALTARAAEAHAPGTGPAGAVRVRRQGPPGRRRGQSHDPADRGASPATPTSATASCSSTTTTSRWRGR